MSFHLTTFIFKRQILFHNATFAQEVRVRKKLYNKKALYIGGTLPKNNKNLNTSSTNTSLHSKSLGINRTPEVEKPKQGTWIFLYSLIQSKQTQRCRFQKLVFQHMRCCCKCFCSSAAFSPRH